MSLDNLPVWGFEPEWSEKLSETLEWLTKVMKSRTGAEQRRILRYTPRRYIEYTAMVYGPERSLFDNMLSGIGMGDFYVPMWHEVFEALPFSDRVLAVDGLAWSLIAPGSAVWVQTAGHGELHEVEALDAATVRLTRSLGLSGARGLTLHPAHRGRFTEMPSVTRRTDMLAVAQTKFLLTDTEATSGDSVDTNGLMQIGVYDGSPLILTPPDEVNDLDYGYERITESLDNMTSIPIFTDVARTAFTSQRYSWRIVGQKDYRNFKNLLYAIRGRARTFRIPTFFSDFEILRPIAPNTSQLYVRNTGYTVYSNMLRNRRDLCIEYADGSRHCTEILSSAVVDDTEEVLTLGGPIPLGFPVMISFLIEARFDQDNIELSHETDTAGVTTASILIRGTPTLRRALPAA